MKARSLFGLVSGLLVFLAVMLVPASPGLGAAGTFSDVARSNPYYPAIRDLVDRGVADGFTDGTFGVDKPAARQQFAKLICGAMDLPVEEGLYSCPFTDVKKTADAPYPYDYVAAAHHFGITEGTTATTFDPYDEVSRAQVVTMVVRAAGKLAPDSLEPVPDGWSGLLSYADPDHGANLRKAEYNGLLAGIQSSGDDLGDWDIYGSATRGEVAQILWNLVQERDDSKTEVRTAAFVQALEGAGFVVQEGTAAVGNPINAVDEHFMDSCAGFNAGQFYKRFVVPSAPGGSGSLDDVFKLAEDEAIVYVGKTPPLADYFSFVPLLWARQYPDSHQQTGDWLFASVCDPLNNALVKTEGPGNPFQKNTIVVLTADAGIFEQIRDAAGSAGFPLSMVNSIVLPFGVVRLGTEPESDSLFMLARTANIASKAQEQEYLADDTWAKVYRLTPSVSPEPKPFAQQPWRNRVCTSEEDLIPGLEAGLDRLKDAILAQTTCVQSRPLESVRWFYDSMDVLLDDPASAAYRQFVAGESSDTPYLRSAEDGEPANFLLGKDDMMVVYGVNHAATGIATYSSFGVYGDWRLNHRPPQLGDPLFLYGAGDFIWNGVVGMTNHDFAGSAEQYIPGDPMAPYLYAVRVVRSSRAATGDPYCVVVPEATELSGRNPGYSADGIDLDKPAMIGYRAYLNPATQSGPAYEDLIPDRAIWFELE